MDSAPGTNGAPSSNTAEPLKGLPPGVVVPPRDIRVVLERTADFVGRNGITFENRVMEKNANDPKFSFLKPHDVYRPYYEWRISEYQAGRVHGSVAAATSAQPAPPKPKTLPPPPEFQFSARMPNISALDLDVIRLTAQHVATNGRSWMTGLSQREASNPQFDFLRPQHSLNQFFNRMVDQYSDIINSRGTQKEADRVADLRKMVKDKMYILDRAKQRAEYIKAQERKKQKKEEEAEAERVAFAQIDWQDFSVVCTVAFTEEEENRDMIPPASLNNLQSASLEDRAIGRVSHDRRIEETIPGTELPEQQPHMNTQPLPQRPPAAPSPVNLPPRPSPAPPPPTFAPQPPPTTAHSQHMDAMRTSSLSPTGAAVAGPDRPRSTHPPGMNIRTDYVPRAQQQRQQNVAMGICPNCKQSVPLDEMDHHMKVELLDPRWKDQRAKADSRNATTNLSTTEVANNLKRLASQRSDVFDDVTGKDSGVSAEDEPNRRRKLYDGVSPGDQSRGGHQTSQQSMNIEDQLRNIREKAKSSGGQ